MNKEEWDKFLEFHNIAYEYLKNKYPDLLGDDIPAREETAHSEAKTAEILPNGNEGDQNG